MTRVPPAPSISGQNRVPGSEDMEVSMRGQKEAPITRRREPAGEPRYSRILVGTDGSACSKEAARHAVYLAKTLGARLYALNAVDVERAFHVGIHFGEAVAELRGAGKEATGAVKAMASSSGVDCEEILIDGRPHKTIVRVSDEVEADLIVLGAVGLTGLERTLLGSEAERVLHLSKRPVLLVQDSPGSPA